MIVSVSKKELFVAQMGVLDFVGWTGRKTTPQELTFWSSSFGVWSTLMWLGGAPNGHQTTGGSQGGPRK